MPNSQRRAENLTNPTKIPSHKKRSIAKGRSIACKTLAISYLTGNKEDNAD